MTFHYCCESGQGPGVASFDSYYGDDLPVSAIDGCPDSDHPLGGKWLGTTWHRHSRVDMPCWAVPRGLKLHVRVVGSLCD